MLICAQKALGCRLRRQFDAGNATCWVCSGGTIILSHTLAPPPPSRCHFFLSSHAPSSLQLFSTRHSLSSALLSGGGGPVPGSQLTLYVPVASNQRCMYEHVLHVVCGHTCLPQHLFPDVLPLRCCVTGVDFIFWMQ